MAFSGAHPVTYKNPAVPFCGRIPGGLHEGGKITVKGTVIYSNENRPRFCANFQTGSSNNDIAFHFNPRFEDGGYVVCNTKQNGSWGPEERKRPVPFENGYSFELCFLVQSSEFQVTVNGSFFLQYSHRMPYHHADTFCVDGCVQLSEISFQPAGVWLTCGGPLNAIIPPVVYPNPTYVRVLCESSCLKVAVSGQPLCEYKHHVNDLLAINTMEVGGDTQLIRVQT